MVSWIAGAQQALLVYSASAGTPVLSINNLVNPGSVDANLISRMQYQELPSSSEGTFTTITNMRFTSADFTANPGKYLSMCFFAIKADVFPAGVTPTPADIIAKRKSGYYNSVGGPVTSPGDITVQQFGPSLTTFLEPNTKYWVLLVPAAYNSYDDWNTSGVYRPMAGVDVNVLGRAVSIWTNRTPTAPVITSPPSGTVVNPGATFALTIDPADPDEVGGGTSPQYTDLAGVQVQYSRRPTPDEPNPPWLDLPIGNNGGTRFDPGWAIRQSTSCPSDAGAFNLLANLTLTVRAGFNTPAANSGSLSGGDWRIRVRTFDFGHPRPNSMNPLGRGRDLATLTPDQYPAVNSSPWSTPVIVSVPGQVPPPVPLSPINSTAVIFGNPTVLTWLYRNAAQPPFAQASRTVQIRKTGETAWTTLTSGASASSSYTVAGYTFEEGTEYEWQVQVTDTDGKTSNFSTIARFWVVPALQSGDVRPVPSSTIDGATLGCGKYRVFVYRRGGLRRVAEITDISYLDWGRVRDDISTSKIVVSGWGIDCGNLLSKLKTWAYEIVIMRNNGYTEDRVWEGPITLLTYERDTVTINAKDVVAYPYRRIIKQIMNDSGTGHGTTVVNRAMRVLQNVMAPDDPNVLANMVVLSQSDDSMQYRSTPAYSRTAFEEVDDMAANAGLDYTALGRAIILWSTKHRIGTLPEFRDEDLGAPPIVSEYGMSMANRYVVSDGNGVWGEATRLDVSGNDPIYGLTEMLSSSWASDSSEETGTYTQAGLQTVIDSFEGYAERSIADRYSPGAPVVVRVPDNTTLNPSAVISIQQLVPGVVIPLRSTGTLRKVVASQKLDAVKVVVEGGEEKISITMSPFSRDDNATEETE